VDEDTVRLLEYLGEDVSEFKRILAQTKGEIGK